MQVERQSCDQINAEEWNAFIRSSPQGAIFHLCGFMNVISPGWEGIILRKDGKIQAVMPLSKQKKAIYAISTQPLFSQYWGICFAPIGTPNQYKIYSNKQKWAEAILAEIPKELKWVGYGFAPEFDYPLPFHWNGYQLRTRYTYHLDLTVSESELLSRLKGNTRRDIENLAKEGYVLSEEDSADPLLKLMEENRNSGKTILGPSHEPVCQGLTAFLKDNSLGGVLALRDSQGKVVAAGLFTTFKEKTTFLVGAVSPNTSHNRAMSYFLWNVFLRAKKTSSTFDFEGSMVKGIESYFRSFSSKPIPYLFIEKNELPLLLRWIQKLR